MFGLEKCPFRWIKSILLPNNLVFLSQLERLGEMYPAADFVNIFKKKRKPTVELNLEFSRNKDQFDFAIYKPLTLAVEEFRNILLKNIK